MCDRYNVEPLPECGEPALELAQAVNVGLDPCSIDFHSVVLRARSMGLHRVQLPAIAQHQGAANFAPYLKDLARGYGQNAVDWPRFLEVLKTYLDARDLTADWDSIQRSPTELLINTLSMISPYGPEEKQALLEAPDLKARSEVLMALAEMEIAAPGSGPGTSLH